jgi:hypothetical protein
MAFRSFGAGLIVTGLLFAQTPNVDMKMFRAIHDEAYNHSQADAIFEMLTVNIGPRLTASPAHKRAAEFARERLAAFGLENARLEPWQFGRGWTQEKLTVEMVEPRYLPLIGYADGWSPGMAQEITAAPVYLGGKTPEEVDGMKSRLKGAIVMTQPMMVNFIRKDRPNPSDPNYPPNGAAYATSVGQAGRGRGAPTPVQRITASVKEAGAGVILKPSAGEHGTVFVTGRDEGPGAVPTITLSGDHYNMIVRMIEKGIPVRLRVNLQTKYYDTEGGKAYNVLAELPGSDPAVRDEVVMMGAHIDSWHTGVGATDNADGSTTVMEAMRILKAVGAKPRRTIRVALWGGEEQGLLGSRAWVKEHLAGDANKAARDKFDVYLNTDNGTGPVYGWYMERRAPLMPLFDAWLAPLKEYGARRNNIEPVGSTDHISFNDAGVPGFNPIQDYTNYDIRTHHTNVDTADRLNVQDIRQAAMSFAWFAYNAAMADQKIPRDK